MAFATDKKINSVIVTEIETPYAEGRELDTNAKVPKDACYRITNIAWKTPEVSSSGYYEVTVTLNADIGYVFSSNTIGTINGNSIISKELIEEEELSITYAFSSESASIGNSTSTLIHRISTYCDAEMGKISPYIIRVSHGDNQLVKITPNEGFEIKDVVVDGESVGAISEYEFKNVKENHTIKAYFEEKEMTMEEILKNKPLLKVIIDILKVFKF